MHDTEVFHDAIYGRVSQALKVETIRVEVVRVVGGGESAWAAVESLCTATSKYGKSISMTKHLSTSLGPISLTQTLTNPETPYHLEFVDLVRFNSQGKIAQMKEFLDSGHIQKHVERHEGEKK